MKTMSQTHLTQMVPQMTPQMIPQMIPPPNPITQIPSQTNYDPITNPDRFARLIKSLQSTIHDLDLLPSKFVRQSKYVRSPEELEHDRISSVDSPWIPMSEPVNQSTTLKSLELVHTPSMDNDHL